MSGRSSLAAGKRWELAAAKYAEAKFHEAGHTHVAVRRRAALGLHEDEGDLFGIPGVAIQCKNTTRFDLTMVDQAQQQAQNAGVPYGVLLQKRRNSNTGSAYSVMTYDALLSMLVEMLDIKKGT